MAEPVIITNSISGAVANRDHCPAIPYTPEEYAAEARRAVDEGAVMIHIHARTPDGVPSYEAEDFRAITEAILADVDDVIVNYSTGAIGVPLDKRIAYLRELRPDVGALNMGSMNYAKYSRRRGDFVFKTVFENSFDTIIELCAAMREAGIRPEHECFDSGHLANLDPLLDMGLLEPPLQISCVMGVTGGIRPSARNLAHMAEQVPAGVPHEWGVIGVSRDQWSLVGAALALGGNVRVGLEDNFYLPDGEMARSNGDLVARARRMCEGVGRRPATLAEARGRPGAPRPAPAAPWWRGRGGGARTSGGGRPPSRRRGSAWGRRGAPLRHERRARGRPRPGPHPPAPGRLLHRPARRLRRRRAQGGGHGAGRLRALGAAALRGRGAERRLGAVPRAQPQQALDPREPQDRRGARGAAPSRARGRRARRGLPPRGHGPPRRRL